ncbi:hypothetical protein ACQKCJ_08790 [Flavobacterium sp. NPDC079362]|uniref:hypothetical protein n=1 Tax=Flavobacterium sp. NPDC079362 TaxID=3390566 RepID=UPI003D04F1EE
MNFLAQTISIIIQVILLVLSIVWYRQDYEIEPLIGIITLCGSSIISLLMRFVKRPKMQLYHVKTHYGRWTTGLTKNNPQVIRLGIDKIDQYWDLEWDYNLEIRNNSSFTAYNIVVEYNNIPEKTIVKGEIGKIEPVQSHDMREFKIKVTQSVEGNHIEADNYLKQNEGVLTKDFTITLKYTDENGIRFRTKYFWLSQKNEFLIF